MRHCSILEFGSGARASNQAVTAGITRPLHATDSKARKVIVELNKICLYNVATQHGDQLYSISNNTEL